MFTSRRARIATLVAAGVLGFGGMAAASPSLGGDKPPVDASLLVEQDDQTDGDVSGDDEVDVLEEADTGEEQGEEQTAEAVEVAQAEIVELDTGVLPAESSDPESVDDGATAFNEDNCAEGNHGKTVSAVARGDSDFLEKYAMDNGGEIPTVPEAAHSKCGKTDRDQDDTEESDAEESDTEESDAEESDAEESDAEESDAEESAKADKKPERPSKGAEGQGNGKSNGNGKRGG